MALDTIWIAVASVLAAFDIKKAIDADGNEIVPAVEVEAALRPGTDESDV